jgi:RHS repeat-associated protein
LRRPVHQFLRGSDAANSDPRTLDRELLVEKTVYGEGQLNNTTLNLRTRVFQHHDGSGLVTNMGRNPATSLDEAYDFKGNLLRGRRQLAADYKAIPDWAAAPALEAQVFTTATTYDALNRPVLLIAPDRSFIRPTYNEANLPQRLDVNLRGAFTATTFVTNIDYDAKAQRTLIAYGNKVTTRYAYDPDTFRLTRLTTAREGFSSDESVVQDLSYTYDPTGNITHIKDDADVHNVVFFRNMRVEPSNDYIYDALYRLIEAKGREHLGQSGGQPSAPVPTSYNNVPRVGLLHPGDGTAMGRYTQRYEYDAVGNFQRMSHHGADPATPAWTRTYAYAEPSLLEPGKPSNRLSRTIVNPNGAQPQNEDYAHDPHGSMIRMPQLQLIEWDYHDQMRTTQRQAVNADDADGFERQGERTYYVYGAAGQRTRKVTERSNGARKDERIYLAGFEIYRAYNGNGVTVTLERETLHVMDGERRVALAEIKTIDADAPASSLPSATMRHQFDNHLGTACLELDENAVVISYEEYYPYGCTSYQAGRTIAEASLKRYRYIGRERDEETGLYYLGARYYAPWLGRWIAADPAGLVDGDNLMRYARNNPIRFTDASGTESTDDDDDSESSDWDVSVSQDLSFDPSTNTLGETSFTATRRPDPNANSPQLIPDDEPDMHANPALDDDFPSTGGGGGDDRQYDTARLAHWRQAERAELYGKFRHSRDDVLTPNTEATLKMGIDIGMIFLPVFVPKISGMLRSLEVADAAEAVDITAGGAVDPLPPPEPVVEPAPPTVDSPPPKVDTPPPSNDPIVVEGSGASPKVAPNQSRVSPINAGESYMNYGTRAHQDLPRIVGETNPGAGGRFNVAPGLKGPDLQNPTGMNATFGEMKSISGRQSPMLRQAEGWGHDPTTGRYFFYDRDTGAVFEGIITDY